MIDEFQKVLKTPKQSSTHILSKTQDLILTTFEQIFAQNFDIQPLHQIYQQTLGTQICPQKGQLQVTVQQQITLNYKLTLHLIQQVKQNFIPMNIYQSLQDQTQKAQSIIRSHIRVQQEMKMYLEYLETKMDRMGKKEQSSDFYVEVVENLRREVCLLGIREEALRKEKIGLIKKNQKLKYELQFMEIQLQKLKLSREPSQKTFPKKFHPGLINRKCTSELSPQKKTPRGYVNETDSNSKHQTTNNNSHLSYSQKQKQIQKQKQGSKIIINHDCQLTQKKQANYFPGKN